MIGGRRLFAIGGLCLIASTGSSRAAERLQVGKKAPSLDVAEWVDRDRASAVSRAGLRVVVAGSSLTPPTQEAWQRVGELCEKWGGRVEIVGVEVWPGSNPRATLARLVSLRGRVEIPLAIDHPLSRETGSVARDWLLAADLHRLPVAFVVGPSGTLRWIGHPDRLEEAVAELFVREGGVSSVPTSSKGRDQEDFERIYERLREQHAVELRINGAWNDERWAVVVAGIEELCLLDPSAEVDLCLDKYEALLQIRDSKRVLRYGRELLEGVLSSRPRFLNSFAWMIVSTKGTSTDSSQLDLALKAARRANELTEFEDAAKLDTLARVYFCRGNLHAAWQYQRIAVRKAEDRGLRQDLSTRLKEYTRLLEESPKSEPTKE